MKNEDQRMTFEQLEAVADEIEAVYSARIPEGEYATFHRERVQDILANRRAKMAIKRRVQCAR